MFKSSALSVLVTYLRRKSVPIDFRLTVYCFPFLMTRSIYRGFPLVHCTKGANRVRAFTVFSGALVSKWRLPNNLRSSLSWKDLRNRRQMRLLILSLNELTKRARTNWTDGSESSSQSGSPCIPGGVMFCKVFEIINVLPMSTASVLRDSHAWRGWRPIGEQHSIRRHCPCSCIWALRGHQPMSTSPWWLNRGGGMKGREPSDPKWMCEHW